jgi:hypothetical protein
VGGADEKRKIVKKERNERSNKRIAKESKKEWGEEKSRIPQIRDECTHKRPKMVGVMFVKVPKE